MSHKLIKNTKGRTFFTGDIHGCFTKLMNALDKVSFSPENGDLLVTAGDIVDRGPENVECLSLVYEKWFKTSYGNHEELMVKAITNGKESYEENVWFYNGGIWYDSLSKAEKSEVNIIALEVLSKLPTVITVITKSGHRIGVVHASTSSYDWNDVIKDSQKPDAITDMIWKRDHANYVQKALRGNLTPLRSLYLRPIENIDSVVFGHTPMKNGLVFSYNQAWLDTGVVFGNELVLIEDVELIEQARKSPVAEQLRTN